MHDDLLDGYRLSPQQRQLWLRQRTSAAPAWSRCAVRLDGELDRPGLARAIRRSIERHEILRTTFRRLPGMSIPLQVVDDTCVPEVSQIDLSGLDPDRQSRVLDQWIEPPTEDPALQLCLFRVAPTRHVLLLGVSALCADARTLDLWVGDIATRYAAGAESDGGDDEEMLQYCDLAEWLNQLLESDETRSGRDYWRGRAATASGMASLPFEAEREDGEAQGPCSIRVTWDEGLTTRIDELAAELEASRSDLLLAAWTVLLFRHAGHAPLVGVRLDGRDQPELAAALGLFERHLPFRAELDERSCFSEVVSAGGRAVRELEKWQQYFSWNDGDDGGSSDDLLCVGFESDDPSPPVALGGVEFSVVRRSGASDSFRLKLSCSVAAGRVGIQLHFDPARFVRRDVLLLVDQLETLTRAAVDDPRSEVGRLRLAGEAEIRALAVDFNSTAAAYPEAPVHRLFRDAARAGPDGIAVVFEDRRLSYAELDRRADGVARALRDRGVGPDERVALLVERSPEFVIGLLGALKAGAAYVPLDPTQPGPRLSRMLTDAGPRAVLTTRDLMHELALDPDAVLLLDQLDPSRGGGAELVDPVPVDPGNLAYVIFTSGSSGRPKGVAVEHRQLCNYVHAVRDRLQLAEGASYATVSTVAADLGNTAIFPALCSGGCLHVLSDERTFEPSAMADYFRRNPVDCLKIVPSHLAATLVSADADAVLPGARLILGGEAAEPTLLRVLEQLPGDRVTFNHYGPTESTVGTLTHRAGPGATRDTRGALPLGRPLPNTEAYVLDPWLVPLPRGVAGELYIGGSGLARGYLGRPDRTASSFVPHPFAGEPGARLYRTGDRCRFLPDGEIEFLGRIDEQVNVRGYRIEPGEIAAALEDHPSVRQVIVVDHDDPSGARGLVAYVVPAAGELDEPGLRELRRFLLDRLPDYMVPRWFVSIAAIPLTPNGKIDRRALPQPAAGVRAEACYAPPRTPAEEQLATLWSETLGIERVGVHDDFFELGGHSLLAMQVVARVRETFRAELPLRVLFETPTVAGLARAVASARRAAVSPPIERVSRGEDLPLSFAQRRLWFLDRLMPGNPAYNLPGAVRLAGTLDVAALERTFAEIVRRHEILRTTFPTVEGLGVQSIAPPSRLSVPLVDLGDLPAPLREAAASDLATAEGQRPFVLVRGPLIRVRLLRLAVDDHAVLVTLHHIVGDGWSRGVFVREIAALYSAFTHGQVSPLPELPVQYADFACWQRDWLDGPALEELSAYWRRQLADLPVLRLPTDRPRRPMTSFDGARVPVVLPRTLAAPLRALAGAERATLFMTLLAAFQVLLGRYGAQHDVAVGSPVAGRPRPELDDLIGFFVNQLVLRTKLDDDGAFRDVLGRVRETCLDAYAHQDLPFEKLVDELQPTRDLSREPLFQVMLVLQNAPMPAIRIPGGLELRPQDYDSRTAKFDLTLVVWDGPAELVGFFEYKTELFDQATIERMRGHLEALLQAAVDDPARRLGDVELLAAAERRQLLVDWNDTDSGFTSHAGAQELFEAQVDERPEAVAALSGDATLSYGELDTRANALARTLEKGGVGPEVVVAVLLDRSSDLLVALLGILKAGGVYLPLDPAHPDARLGFMVEDAAARMLVTESSFDDRLPAPQVGRVRLDDGSRTEASVAIGRMPCKTCPANRAYVIYTSGSTGQPKGTSLTHHGLCNLATAQRKALGITAGDRVLQFASPGYDASVWEIVMALSAGAALIFGDSESALPGPALIRLLREQQVTTVTLPPTVLGALPTEPLPRLRTVVAAGEACTSELVARWAPGRRFYNAYGPTETTVCATLRRCRTNESGPPPIGRPVANGQVYVVAPDLRLQPIGVPGELCVGGAPVGRGYVGRADLTAERFVPDPFAGEGARIYRTGDLARWRTDGELEFLGRIDAQVKLRGVRIEPGELEAVLVEHEGVRQAAVVAREDRPGDRRLVAYLVVDDRADSAVGAPALRRYLQARVPEPMIPSAFVLLGQLPLTSSGKVDRRALPSPDGLRPELESEFVAPRTDVESELARLWSEVLGLDRVGVHDNFFELGGDSIQIIQVVARATRSDLRLTPAQMFQYQTIADLASVAGSTLRVEAEQGAVTGPAPLTPIQRWFLDRDPVDPHHWNMSMFFELQERLDPEGLRRAVVALLEHHDALRMRYERTAEGWTQRFAEVDAAQARAVVVCIDLGALAGDVQRQALESSATALQRSLDLSRGPLLRVGLFDRGPSQTGRLLVVGHHLVLDGVSWRILLADLLLAYEQAVRGQLPRLVAKTTSFREWSERLSTHARSEELGRELEYWRDLLVDPPPGLPLDLGGGVGDVESTETVAISLDAEQTRALLQEVPRAYRTQVNDVLLAAVVGAIGAWTGRSSLLIDVEGHGREDLFDDVDVSRTVGWFTSLYPVRLDLPDGAAPGARVKAVKEQLRRVPNKGIGYGLLRYLRPGSALSGAAPQVSFNYFGQVDRELGQAGPYGPAPEYAGPLRSAKGKRTHLLTLTAVAAAGQLVVRWSYSRDVHRRATVEAVAAGFLDELQALIEHCRSVEVAEWTPSDFPLARLDDQGLGQVASLIEGIDADERDSTR